MKAVGEFGTAKSFSLVLLTVGLYAQDIVWRGRHWTLLFICKWKRMTNNNKSTT